MIPFIDLKTQQKAIRSDIDKRINNVLEHGQYIMGPEVVELEAILAKYVGTKYCITVSSGTEALLISLMALGIGPGDEVITTPFTFAATAEVIALVGATPVFVDIDPLTANINPALIAAKITSKTKAIMPVSLYGQACDMDGINKVAGNIPVIEDAAQSFGGTYKAKKSCALSTIGCTSFFPSKPLGCYGDGGAIFTDREDIAIASKEIRIHGQSKRYHHTRIGLGGRMDTLQCAILLAKWPRFENEEVKKRSQMGELYTNLIHKKIPQAKPVCFSDIGKSIGIRTLHLMPENLHVYAQYSILVDNREAVQAKLLGNGIPSAVHYPIPLTKQPAYKDISRFDKTEISDWYSEHIMSLPMGPDLTGKDQLYIVETLAQILNEQL